jgi:TonB family protein
MRAALGGFFRRRPLVGVGASVLLHALLVLAVILFGAPGPAPEVKRGEPLFVELPNVEEPAPRGNPASREPGAPAPTPAPSPVQPPAPAKPSPPVVAKAPAPARPAPAPSAREPERVASARVREPTPAARTPNPEDSAPAPEAAKTAPVNQDAPPTSASRPTSEGTRMAMAPSRGASPAPDLRAALRRGGGAGGAADGRGGIEGEPIRLDSTDPRYSDYLDRIRRMIKEKWGYPCVKNASTRACDYKTTNLVIEFGIARDGVVPFVNVLRPSGYQIYDDYAVNAIKLAAPFPRVPPEMGGAKGVPIEATFSYLVDTSLSNVLR